MVILVQRVMITIITIIITIRMQWQQYSRTSNNLWQCRMQKMAAQNIVHSILVVGIPQKRHAQHATAQSRARFLGAWPPDKPHIRTLSSKYLWRTVCCTFKGFPGKLEKGSPLWWFVIAKLGQIRSHKAGRFHRAEISTLDESPWLNHSYRK